MSKGEPTSSGVGRLSVSDEEEAAGETAAPTCGEVEVECLLVSDVVEMPPVLGARSSPNEVKDVGAEGVRRKLLALELLYDIGGGCFLWRRRGGLRSSCWWKACSMAGRRSSSLVQRLDLGLPDSL